MKGGKRQETFDVRTSQSIRGNAGFRVTTTTEGIARAACIHGEKNPGFPVQSVPRPHLSRDPLASVSLQVSWSRPRSRLYPPRAHESTRLLGWLERLGTTSVYRLLVSNAQMQVQVFLLFVPSPPFPTASRFLLSFSSRSCASFHSASSSTSMSVLLSSQALSFSLLPAMVLPRLNKRLSLLLSLTVGLGLFLLSHRRTALMYDLKNDPSRQHQLINPHRRLTNPLPWEGI